MVFNIAIREIRKCFIILFNKYFRVMKFNYKDMFFLILTRMYRFFIDLQNWLGVKKTARLCVVVLQPVVLNF